MDLSELLLKLQSADLRLESLREQIIALEKRERSKKLREALVKAREAGEKAAESAAEVRARQSQLEHQVAIWEERLASDQKSLYGGKITNPKELKTLQDDIVSRTRHKDELETKLLETLEDLELSEGREKELQALVARLEKEISEIEGENESRLNEAREALSRESPVRDELAGKLPAEILERYEGLRRRKGIAVGELKDATCGSCGIPIPSAQVEQLLAAPLPWTCPLCGRMLVPGRDAGAVGAEPEGEGK